MAKNTKLSTPSRSALTKIAHFSEGGVLDYQATASLRYVGYCADGTATTDEAKWAIKKIEIVDNVGGTTTTVITWAGSDTLKDKVFSTAANYICDYSGTFGFVNEK